MRHPAPRLPWEDLFLYTLSETGNVTYSAEVAGITRQTAYEHRNINEAFSALWDDAIEQSVDALELEARRRAKEGVKKPVFWQGQEIATVAEHSDTLLIFLLKAHRPKKYRENRQYSLEDILDALPPDDARQLREALAAALSPG